MIDIPDFGVTMAASPLPKSFDTIGWWVFEKYDGIRAVSLRIPYYHNVEIWFWSFRIYGIQ